MRKPEGSQRKATRAAAAATAFLGGMLAMSSAWAALPNCSVAVLTSLSVPNMSFTSATDVPAAGGNPEYCLVGGSLVTRGEGAPNGSALFNLELPANWNGKFLFFGVGGLAGSTLADFAANPVDAGESLIKGYAIAITDTGHEAGNTDASWALTASGSPDYAKIADYYYRATHQVTIAAQALTRKYYRQKISKSYFDGCSNGGRQALVEATTYPDDFDGIIAGDPFMGIRAITGGVHFQKQQLTPQTFIPAAMFPAIDQATIAACDAADGVADGLIQNPLACSFDPKALQCTSGQTSNCLSPGQVATLRQYITATRDRDGEVVYPGETISDLGGTDGIALWSTGFIVPDFTAAEPWGGDGFGGPGLLLAPLGWQFSDHIIQYLVERDPTFNLRSFDVSAKGVIGRAALALFDERTVAGDADQPERLREFIDKDKKLLIYHGFSDPALTAVRSVMFYERLAWEQGGFDRTQRNVRLFLAPGMHHCEGGPGPNFFDTLTPLEDWVEQGQGPEAIIAAHFPGNVAGPTPDRTMPLCKFPEQARFTLDPKTATPAQIDNALNWVCPPRDKSLLLTGADGFAAGIGSPIAPERDRRRDHDRR